MHIIPASSGTGGRCGARFSKGHPGRVVSKIQKLSAAMWGGQSWRRAGVWAGLFWQLIDNPDKARSKRACRQDCPPHIAARIQLLANCVLESLLDRDSSRSTKGRD